MARSFNAATDLITVADYTAIQNIWDGGGTASMHFYPKSLGEGSNGRLYEKSVNRMLIQSNAGENRATFAIDCGTTGGIWRIASNVSFNAWHTLVVIYDADSTANDPAMYLDGGGTVSEGQAPVGTRLTDVGANLIIGNRVQEDRTWDGLLAEAAFWNVALTESEALALSKGISPDQIRPASLVAYFTLNGRDSPERNLAPGSVNNGTLTGTAYDDHPRIFRRGVYT